ncbi:transcription factor GTE7-like [Lycium barbarum]|uniref:transcription factor GTE7-like n=1 Tax=Lycium barbarum TaxID=112863 RepID=UPI00293E2478|nr:transcription factor GTE7-like [Lycium barbarum]
MPQLVQIIRKRNEHLAQDGELDIEALDKETLWELDRFVANWKKMVSKTKRQALINNLGPPSASAATTSADGSTRLGLPPSPVADSRLQH